MKTRPGTDYPTQIWQLIRIGVFESGNSLFRVWPQAFKARFYV